MPCLAIIHAISALNHAHTIAFILQYGTYVEMHKDACVHSQKATQCMDVEHMLVHAGCI
jgi:hypothetical protein